MKWHVMCYIDTNVSLTSIRIDDEFQTKPIFDIYLLKSDDILFCYIG